MILQVKQYFSMLESFLEHDLILLVVLILLI